MALTPEQRRLLGEPLDARAVAQRKQAGQTLSYLEGHFMIAQANRIFGFDGWGYTVDRVDMTPMPDGRGVLYSAAVSVLVDGCGLRQDVGCAVIRNTTVVENGAQRERDNVNNPDQHDLARKGAVTDALKRALRSFGDQFGNGLYDKDSTIHTLIAEAQRNDGSYEMRLVVRDALAEDPETAAKLKKSWDQMTREEIVKTRDWLARRAQQVAASTPSAASTDQTAPDLEAGDPPSPDGHADRLIPIIVQRLNETKGKVPKPLREMSVAELEAFAREIGAVVVDAPPPAPASLPAEAPASAAQPAQDHADHSLYQSYIATMKRCSTAAQWADLRTLAASKHKIGELTDDEWQDIEERTGHALHDLTQQSKARDAQEARR